jgi:hypothetical protein
MDPPRRIGKHLKHVIFWFALIACGREDASVFPASLPFRFYFTRLIAHLFGLPCKHFCWYGDSGFGAQRPELRWAFSQWLVRVSVGSLRAVSSWLKGHAGWRRAEQDRLGNCGIHASVFARSFTARLPTLAKDLRSERHGRHVLRGRTTWLDNFLRSREKR